MIMLVSCFIAFGSQQLISLGGKSSRNGFLHQQVCAEETLFKGGGWKDAKSMVWLFAVERRSILCGSGLLKLIHQKGGN